MRRKCNIPDCHRVRVGRGYCGKHYQRLMKHGDPLAPDARFSPSAMRNMTAVERAWAGAFIDAEGSVLWVADRGSYAPRVSLESTDPEYISTLLRVTGIGTAHYRDRPSPLSTRASWVWAVYRWRDVVALIDAILPYSIKAQGFRDHPNARDGPLPRRAS